jgi:hypothetical protein
MNWTRAGVAGLLAVSMFGVPQIASARDRDRCDKRGYNNGYAQQYGYYQDGYRDNRSAYRDQGYRDRAYRDQAYRDQAYRNGPYRDSGYRNSGSGDYGYEGDYRRERSVGKSAAIVGGSAAAGAVIGGLAGGGKGAAIGAAVGGVGGLIYDRSTTNRNRW